MRRIILVPTDTQEEQCYLDCVARDEAPLVLFEPDYSLKVRKEWLYAAQALVIYPGGGDTDDTLKLINFAVHIGLPIEFRSLDGTVEELND